MNNELNESGLIWGALMTFVWRNWGEPQRWKWQFVPGWDLNQPHKRVEKKVRTPIQELTSISFFCSHIQENTPQYRVLKIKNETGKMTLLLASIHFAICCGVIVVKLPLVGFSSSEVNITVLQFSALLLSSGKSRTCSCSSSSSSSTGGRAKNLRGICWNRNMLFSRHFPFCYTIQ